MHEWVLTCNNVTILGSSHLCTLQLVMFVFICNYKSTSFPIVQLTYILCKIMSSMQQLNDNKWPVKELNSSTACWTTQIGANMQLCHNFSFITSCTCNELVYICNYKSTTNKLAFPLCNLYAFHAKQWVACNN